MAFPRKTNVRTRTLALRQLPVPRPIQRQERKESPAANRYKLIRKDEEQAPPRQTGAGAPGQPPPLDGTRPAWEPDDPSEWERRDPLGPGGDWPSTERSLYDAEALFHAWQRLPEDLRAQCWRERQISAFAFRGNIEAGWATRLPALEWIGVGRRPWEATGLPGAAEYTRGASLKDDDRESYQSYLAYLGVGEIESAAGALRKMSWGGREILGKDPLAIILRVRPPLPPYTQLYEALGLQPVLVLDERTGVANDLPLEDYGLSRYVPVVFEVSHPIFPLHAAGAGAAQAASNNLQSGMKISGRFSSGTLGAIVSRPNDPDEYLLGAQHVLGDQPNPVSLSGARIGEVVESDASLDVSLVRIDAGYHGLPEILGLNQKPEKPTLPTNGLHVEFYGAESKAQQPTRLLKGFKVASSGSVQNLRKITQVNITPPEAYNLGKPLLIEIEGRAQKGDSGALFIIHQKASPGAVNPTQAGKLGAWSQLYPHAAILGNLVGYNSGSTPPKIYATHALQVEAALAIEWKTN